MPPSEEKFMNKEVITIVSGLPRSGTSTMMNMLEAGGMDVLIDNIRKSDEDNPKGYYEFEKVKKIEKDSSWLEDARGKAIKIISVLVRFLPRRYRYNIIFMLRNMQEILDSQRQMLIRRGEFANAISDEEMERLFLKDLEMVKEGLDKQPNMNVIYISYNQLLTDPSKYCKEIMHFLGINLDIDNMIKVIDNTLYRQRR